ncbi:Signal transduction histidine kinase-like protein [uncultured Alphaproteobacteria bacterium]|uniref:histidine kinase n=1 Tax=uncultured Alphaproteobacteria bacterium TaxID=91750 RepID=A0A212KLM3_9PROT|nr:Signal transduction histidine kinase-like protein [uncultured Alphaproteobacteria bacterium]
MLMHGFFLAQAQLERERRIASVTSTVHRTADLVGAILAAHANDVRILAALMPVRNFAAGDDSARAGVIRIFSAFVEQKPVIAQLRYLDAAGWERVRVDGVDGKITVVPVDELQDKSDRYYFRNAIHLPPTEIYVSPVDLNVEHGVVDDPWNPMPRLARTIPGPDGRALGIVIVNIRADEMIREVDRGGRDGDGEIQWLNGDGYWLAGAPRDKLWGFMFGRDTTMAKIRPTAWARIFANRGDGVTVGTDDGVTYIHRSVTPAAVLSETGSDEGAAADWKFVGTIPAVGLADLWTPRHIGFAVAGLVLLAALSLAWSRSVVARHRAEAREAAAAQELIMVERLASLGGLVAGVAHELNTPIGNAVTVASTIGERIKDFRAEAEAGPLRRASLDAFLSDVGDGAALMLRGLDRTARLIQQFKQVAVDQTSQQRRRFRIADTVQDVLGTLGPQFKHTAIRIESEVGTDALLDSYPGPLGQVVMNLVNNARVHAFAPGAAGVIRIAARSTAGNRIEITVADDGAGMPEEVRRRAFEPFFTTRLGEGGSGLGLSIVHNIVAGVLGGSVDIASEPGTGTIFTVSIPCVAPAEPESGRIYNVGS